MTRRSVLLLAMLVLSCAAVGRAQQASSPAGSAAGPVRPPLNPDAEGVASPSVAEGGDTEARFLFKVGRRRYNRRYPGGYNNNNGYDYNNNGYDYNNNGYDYNNNNNYQCSQCGYGAVDYTTARRCCQQGYTRCCFETSEEKPGVCPYNYAYSSSSYGYSSECSSDTDCYSTQKCCRRGSSRSCQYPQQGGGDYEKPGTCPYRGSSSQGDRYPSYPYYSTGGTGSIIGGSNCRRDCYRDQECPGSQKCCEVNCSSVCVTPQRYY